MAGNIPRTFIDDLLLRVDIVDLIDSQVPLKKAGSNHVARCPFHNEKTPSFSVNRSKQFYHCFGCGISGNAISFLMDYNHLNFVEAIEDLASFVGVDVPREEASAASFVQVKQNLADLYPLNQQAANFYAQQLRSNSEGQKAITYFKNRGLSGEVVRDFMLGYAPDQWHNLDHLSNPEQLLEVGLQTTNDSGQQYDRFRGRIIFPIRDKRGRVIAFGGRVLDDSLPKYLNSPETALFHKGKEVYGLYELLQKNTKPERILIVEGYMDVIALAQYGINYAVATLGTASSKSHFDLLFRFSSELVLCFDGDSAGLKAAWRAVEAAFPSLRDNRQVRIMILPNGQDPDTLIRDQGAKRFSQNIAESQPLSDYFFKHISANLNLNDMEGRASLIEKARPYLDQLSNSHFRDMMIERLKHQAQTSTLDVFANATKLTGAETRNKPSSARIANALLLQNPELAKASILTEVDWSALESPGLSLLRKTLEKIKSSPNITLGGLCEDYRGEPEQKHIASLAEFDDLIPGHGREAEFAGSFKSLVRQARDQNLAKLLEKEQQQGLSKQEKQLMLEMLQNKEI
jgi:DNA primase